jgi:beta-N-acetylhexosaminidase
VVLGSSTKLQSGPVRLAFGVCGVPDLTEAAAAASVAEMRALGFTLNLAPVADLLSDYRNPVIGTRAYGEDPLAMVAHVAAAIRSLQREEIRATAKHFPRHGDVSCDSHYTFPRTDYSYEELAPHDLVPLGSGGSKRRLCDAQPYLVQGY